LRSWSLNQCSFRSPVFSLCPLPRALEQRPSTGKLRGRWLGVVGDLLLGCLVKLGAGHVSIEVGVDMLPALLVAGHCHGPTRMLWLIAVPPHREHVALQPQPSSNSTPSPSQRCSQGPPV